MWEAIFIFQTACYVKCFYWYNFSEIRMQIYIPDEQKRGNGGEKNLSEMTRGSIFERNRNQKEARPLLGNARYWHCNLLQYTAVEK